MSVSGHRIVICDRQGSLFCAEQYDPDLNLYYLRARYYNPLTGRFLSKDPEAGNAFDPKTLHKYLYAGGDPVNAVDPTGRAALFQTANLLEASFNRTTKATFAIANVIGLGYTCGILALASIDAELGKRENPVPIPVELACAAIALVAPTWATIVLVAAVI